MKDHTWNVVLLAVFSRIAAIILVALFINPLIHSAHSPELLSPPSARYFLRGFLTWDADHFWTLSTNGYQYDKNHAFFPLLPFIISSTRSGISSLFGFSASITEDLTLVICMLLGNLAFILSALFLYKLSLSILENKAYAYRATLLYILNPASIYFTSIYNESYFALFSIAGMYLCQTAKNYYHIVWAALMFSLATCCRSNAIYLLLFAAWAILGFMFTKPSFLNTLKGVITGLLSLALVGATFYTLTVYIGYEMYCKTPIGSVPDWCSQKIPNIYPHIQVKYWQVGFLRTWIGDERVFRTAAWFSIPFNLLAIIAVVNLVKKYPWKKVLPYAIYFVVLLLTVALIANAEINTRVCASVPLTYWVYGRWQVEAEDAIAKGRKNHSGTKFKDWVKKYIYVAYAGVYFVAEMLLVPTFIGWI